MLPKLSPGQFWRGAFGGRTLAVDRRNDGPCSVAFFSARKDVSGYKINLSKRFRRKDYPAAVRWAARRLAHQA